MKCVVTRTPYTIFGYGGKQVRDNIHSHDLVNAFYHFFEKPRVAEVYNIGGGRYSNCSMLEAIEISEKIADEQLEYTYSETNRIGDHIWWISDISKFKQHYPAWKLTHDITSILSEIHQELVDRLDLNKNLPQVANA
jgi:CDP-paratose 2-epimerase